MVDVVCIISLFEAPGGGEGYMYVFIFSIYSFY